MTCRLLVDAVGSRRALKTLAPALRAGSVEVTELLAVGLFRRGAARFDLRNHRKIAVIDGAIGYVGSQNIVEPNFVPHCPNEELVARVTGPVVQQLQAVLLVPTDQREEFLHTACGADAELLEEVRTVERHHVH